MSGNPYNRVQVMSEWFAEYNRQARMTVPSLAMVHSAYEHDEIDAFDLERLVEAALTGTRVELPEAMARMRLAPVRMTDAPGQVIAYSRPSRDIERIRRMAARYRRRPDR